MTFPSLTARSITSRPLASRSPLAAVSAAAGTVPGAALAAASGLTGLLRRSKPLHPVGHVGTGHLVVTKPDPSLGVALLAHKDTHPCEARWSRAMGLPARLPDIEGFALRFPGAAPDGGDADLLFASTGSHSWSRFALTLRLPRRFGTVTTLLPVRAGGHAVTFRLSPEHGATADGLPPSSYDLEVARGVGRWRRLGRVRLEWSERDTEERFDPVTHTLAGLEQYAFVTALREPAYVAARAATRLLRTSPLPDDTSPTGTTPARATPTRTMPTTTMPTRTMPASTARES